VYTPVGLCWACRRRDYSRPTCEAYPEGIPAEIMIGVVDHRVAYRGDHGLQYLAKPLPVWDGPVFAFWVSEHQTTVGALWMSDDAATAMGWLPHPQVHHDNQRMWEESLQAAYRQGGSVAEIFDVWSNISNGQTTDSTEVEHFDSLTDLRLAMPVR
jgi:hypothetical protein